MELINFDGLTLGSVVAGIISPIAMPTFGVIAKWATRVRLLGRVYFLTTSRFIWRFIALLICSFLLAACFEAVALRIFGIQINAAFVGAFTLTATLAYSQWKFAHVGLHSAQLSVASGTSYASALDLCRDSFSFLGTGAFKLTSEKNFETTLLRCNSDNSKPVRFLLSNPENPLIAEAERRADKVPGTYKENVVRSLRNLKRLREERNARFEVRFYSAVTDRDFENFRIMLIDDDIMLLSYNVYGGESAGRKTAQVVLFKSSMTSSSDNFYFAFQGYFERLWESSAAWDFEEHV